MAAQCVSSVSCSRQQEKQEMATGQDDHLTPHMRDLKG